MSRPKKDGSQNMMYVQQLRFLPAGSVEKLVNLIETELHPKKYAVILHDKDVHDDGTPVDPNIHAMLCFENARSWANVAKILGDKPNYVQYWDKAENGMSYLLHATTNAQDKHQYDPSEVIANFDFPAEYARITEKVKKAQQKQHTKNAQSTKVPFLLDAMYAGVMTKEEVEQQLSGSQYARYHRQVEAVWVKRLENLAAEWRKEMVAQNKQVKTIWIYGDAGTGKTRMAREQAQKMGTEYCISGSSRDIFQCYKGEHTLILDELRPQVMEYQDLLRITDPFGLIEGVMAPSRYVDKALACDLIFVTSPYDPARFYEEQFDAGRSMKYCTTKMIDKLDQLLRRITVTIMLTQEHIYIAEYNASYQSFFLCYPVSARIHIPVPHSQHQKKSPMEIYDAMFS